MSSSGLTMSEEIVISGISGRFPESDNIDELKYNLYNSLDMISEDERRWPLGLYGLPTRSGKIKDLSKFDAQFFGVNGIQANKMDPQLRLLLEVTYEAIVDSGINPETIRGSQTGVYIGAFLTEAEESLTSDITQVTGYEATGAKRNMLSNQISYAFDLKGPSFTIDSACSSSFIALQQAFIGLNSGQCDMAIVGGVNICLKPANVLQFQRLNMLSIDGSCKYLDSSANGYVKSETVSTILLQRKSEAKRIYATIVNTRTNSDGYKEQGIVYPSYKSQSELMTSTLLEAGIKPIDVKYIEAHGTGTAAGDQNESKAIYNVYCENRAVPLLIGSVKTNLGHTEAAAGLCSIAKVLLMFENQSIPPILHFKTPNPNIPSLLSGHLKPVIENTPFIDSVVGINSFGFGGSNVHVLLKPHTKKLTQQSLHIVEDIPRLIPICGRTEQSVKHIINFMEESPQKVTKDLMALLNAISQTSQSSGMKYRGYVLATNNGEAIAVHKKQVNRVPEKRQVWFVFPGMGSQWKAMAKGMIKLKTFMESIQKSANYLNPYGIDLIDLLMSEDDRVLECIVSSSVGIAAVQIALVDVLKELGVEADGFVGHSSGELGCAYADGVLNAEQMILSAYWRVKCIERLSPPKGLMAAIGLTWEEAKRRCPEGVVAACHNGDESVTISGEYYVTQEFLQVLRSENVFVREVKSCEIALHSHYMKAVASDLLQELNKVIPHPLPRSNRWISSSVPEDEWNEDYAKLSSSFYYVNNLTSPVLFHEAVQHIPKDSIVIEIAPHSLFEPILKQSLGSNISHISLMKRNNNSENLDLLLSSVGKLYVLGLNPKVDKLYPQFKFPVARGTQSISSLIKWDHSENWLVTLYPEYFHSNASKDYSIKIDLNAKQCAFLDDHCIDGRILFPATGYLMLVWQMLAKNMGLSYDQIPIEFEDVNISRGTILSKESQTEFVIKILETTGEFSISEGGTIAVTGRVRSPDRTKLIFRRLLNDRSVTEDNELRLDSRQVYKELRIRGYDYGSEFQQILQFDGSRGSVRYRNWITFTDAMLQMKIVGKYSRDLYLPISIQSIRCDPIILAKAVDQSLASVLNVVYNPLMDVSVADGLEIHGIELSLAPRRTQMPTIEKFKFIPYFEENALEENDRLFLSKYIKVCSQLSRKVMKFFNNTFSQINAFQETEDNSYVLDEEDLISSSEEYVILKALKELLAFNENEFLKEKIKQFLNKYENEIQKDIVNNVFTKHQLIRPALDVVIENLSSDEMNILEINSSPNIVYSKVLSIIESNLRKVNVKYTLNEKTDLENLKLISDYPNLNISKIERTQSIFDLIIYKECYLKKDYALSLEDIYFVTKNNGFVVALIRTGLTPAEHLLYKLRDLDIMKTKSNHFISKALTIGFSLVSVRTDSVTSSVIVLRKTVPTQLSQQSFVEINSTDYSWVEKLKSKLKEHESKPIGQNIWLIGDDLRTNGVVGLVKCLGREPGGHRIRCILSQLNDNQSLLTSDVVKQSIYCDVFNNDLVMNVYRDGKFGSFRHLDIDLSKDKTYIKTRQAFLNQTKRGDISSFQWFTSYNGLDNKQNNNICDIYYSSLSYNDIVLSTGKASYDSLTTDISVTDSTFGSEFTGRDSNGNRLMGIILSKCLATSVVVNNTEYLWSIPQNWTMEEAITVPMSYSQAFYALIVRGDLKTGDTVLIHTGSGGVEEAAISICLHMKCNVYITVSSTQTIDLLRNQFSELNENNFVNSLENSFEYFIIEKTNGRGVDVIFNSVSDGCHSLEANIRCLAQNGRFIELSKAQFILSNSSKKHIYSKNISIHCIDLEDVLHSSVNQTPISVFHRQQIHGLLDDGIKSGSVRPLKKTIFSIKQIEEAFNYISSKHFGKVVVKIRGEEPFYSMNNQKFQVNAISRVAFHPHKSYIILGGLGGFGLELANWLIERGARKLVLTSRSGPRNAYQHFCLKRLHSFGAQVMVLNLNSSTIEDSTRLITESLSLGPVGGIFNLAMVLSDALFENQSYKTFENVCSAKINITLNLDSISRQLCPQLDYFVVFSSVSSGRGNAGQTNYGFGNSSMERICEFRRKDGLHGLAIQWGAVGDVGVVAETVVDNEIVVGGTVPQRIQSCISLMDDFLKSNESVVCSLVKSQIQCKSIDKKNDMIESIANILGIRDHKSLSDMTLLSELGIDSLMAIEIKQTLERDYGINISIQEIRSLSLRNLIELRAQTI